MTRSPRTSSASRLAPLALLAALAASAPAMAHLGATPAELERSRSLSTEFVSGEEVFVIDLHLERDVALALDVLVPPQEQWRDHRPALALLGPGLPAARGRDDAVPGGIPSGAGAWVQWNDEPERPIVYENTTRRVWWASPPVALPLRAGEYELRVWSPDGTTGETSVGIGVDDDPLRAEVLRMSVVELLDPS